MTNTYILPEQQKPTRICKLLSGQCIIRVFYNTNFHCTGTAAKRVFMRAWDREFSSGNEGDIGL